MKIAFTGPESSGKSSISKAVAKQLNGTWHAEYAREYLLERGGIYNFDDIEQIAIEQERMREGEPNGLSIHDTENTVLYIWSIFKYQKCSPVIETLLAQQKYAHYFLCSPKNIPWEDDPLREHPNQREELFRIYLNTLKERQFNYSILEGSQQERLEQAVKIIKQLQAQQLL